MMFRQSKVWLASLVHEGGLAGLFRLLVLRPRHADGIKGYILKTGYPRISAFAFSQACGQGEDISE
jgi:hypothetical protein